MTNSDRIFKRCRCLSHLSALAGTGTDSQARLATAGNSAIACSTTATGAGMPSPCNARHRTAVFRRSHGHSDATEHRGPVAKSP